MQRKKLKIGIIALAAILAVSAVAANTFYFIWIETPFEPTNYSWSEPWEVKEMVDFLEGTLTITGCAYQGQVHDVELAIKNVATVSDYYALSFAYTALWYIDEINQEVIIQGAYNGALGIGETMADTTTFQPSVIGVGEVKLNIIDIVWAQAEGISWTIETAGGLATWVKNPVLTGAENDFEPGNIAFTIDGDIVTHDVDLTVEIVETSTIIYQAIETVPGTPGKDFTFDFAATGQSGDLTMRITVILVS